MLSVSSILQNCNFFSEYFIFYQFDNFIPAGKATLKRRRNDVRACRRIDVEKTPTESTVRIGRRFNV